MIYRSNLTCPDLTPHFKHLVSRPMPHSFGHDVPSDWGDKSDDDPMFGLYKKCGMWTHDEAAILYNVARWVHTGRALDIGAHTGWTSMHLVAAGHNVVAVDPMFAQHEFHARAMMNTVNAFSCTHRTSLQYFDDIREHVRFSIICVDGDHEPGKPLEDAQNAAKHLTDTGVIIFHDFIGKPVREAVTWLMDHGFKARVYFTPHMIGLCWRGDFTPPDHTPDPQLLDALVPHITAMDDFDFRRCE